MDYLGGRDIITRVLKKWKRKEGETGKKTTRRKARKLSVWERLGLIFFSFEDSRMGPWAKEWEQHLEAGIEKEMDPLLESKKEYSPANTLVLAQWDAYQTSVLCNYKIINLYCFKYSFWLFATKQQLNSNIGEF